MATRILIACVLFLFMPAMAMAQAMGQTLTWTMDPAPSTCTLSTPSTMLQKSAAQAGPYTTVLTLPILTTTYTFAYPPDNQWYRVATACGASNVLQYEPPVLAYDDTAIKAALAALTARVATLEAKDTVQTTTLTGLDARLDVIEAGPVVTPTPTPISQVIVKSLSETQIEVSCLNGTRPTQQLDATGMKRLVTCSK